jgi:hypothetical protein
MTIYNLTPHAINVYSEDAFVNLSQIDLNTNKPNPTAWYADGIVDGATAIADFPSVGNARIAVTTHPNGSVGGIPTVKTGYGDITGMPEVNFKPDDVLLVSLPLQGNAIAAKHPLASQMATPYKVVRLRSNTSTVLGCMGFSFQ